MCDAEMHRMLIEEAEETYGDPTLGLTPEEYGLITRFYASPCVEYIQHWMESHEYSAEEFIVIWDSIVTKVESAGLDDLILDSTVSIMDGEIRLEWDDSLPPEIAT